LNRIQKSTNNPDWLLSVEQNSWQIEIFISGGLLITLYHLPFYINEWMSEAVNDTLLTTGIVLIFLMALIITKALLIGFATNHLHRAMWLASLGVHFALPDGIKEEDIDYHENVKKQLSPHEGPHQKVLMLEKWSRLSLNIQNPLDHRDYTSINQAGIDLQNEEYLEHHKEGEFIENAMIPSEVINTSFLPVFLPYDQWYDYGLKKSLAHYDAQWDPDYRDSTFNSTDNFHATQRSFNDIHKLSIDFEIIDSLKWYMREHPQTGQLGFHTMVDIDSLDRGGHTLRVYYIQRKDSIELDTFLLRWIPFWKE
jgi:hypothetical protein